MSPSPRVAARGDPDRTSASRVPDASGGSPQAEHDTRSADVSELPHPPGEYPVVVIGSGPGALQTSRSLSHLGIRHAVLSADARPGGTFLRWPHFQRLI